MENDTHPHAMTMEQPIVDAADGKEAIEKAPLPRVGEMFGPWLCRRKTSKRTERGFVVTAFFTLEFPGGEYSA